MLLRGLLQTVLLTALSALLGTLAGIGCAWLRLHGTGWARFLAGAYVELIRNTPYIIQLFFIFFGLPSLGVRLSPEVACVLSMTLNLGAYACEIVRAGLDATPRGQIEAAQSLALNRWQIFTRVVLPPSLARVAGAGGPDHHRDARLFRVQPDLGRGTVVRRQPDRQPHLPQFRVLHRRHARLLALAAALRQLLNWIGPRFVFRR